MKSIYISLCLLIISSCNLSHKNSTTGTSQINECKLSDSSNIYRITNIDSVKDIYIVLAQKKELLYKIVSFHDSMNCINRIKIGQCYNLSLKSVFPDNYFQKDRVSLVKYGSIEVPLGGSKEVVWDLFSIQNLKGLCLY